MTLDEAIKHCLEVAENCEEQAKQCDSDDRYERHVMHENAKCATDHRQLAKWLTELKELREQIQKAKAMLLDSSYTVDIMCNKISGTIGCEKCTYYNPETHDCEVRAYISKTRAFVKGDEAQ